jgi:hypothetical protein
MSSFGEISVLPISRIGTGTIVALLVAGTGVFVAGTGISVAVGGTEVKVNIDTGVSVTDGADCPHADKMKILINKITGRIVVFFLFLPNNKEKTSFIFIRFAAWKPLRSRMGRKCRLLLVDWFQYSL